MADCCAGSIDAGAAMDERRFGEFVVVVAWKPSLDFSRRSFGNWGLHGRKLLCFLTKANSSCFAKQCWQRFCGRMRVSVVSMMFRILVIISPRGQQPRLDICWGRKIFLKKNF